MQRLVAVLWNTKCRAHLLKRVTRLLKVQLLGYGNLEVEKRRTTYRILLGSFRSKQPMTLFKGVQPLYITTNEEGNYEYYTGGFDSLIKAEETQLFLKDKGFKQPEICRWTDGQMVNISQQREDDDQDEIVLSRYMVVVGCETMEDAMRSAIETTAPDKMISRRGLYRRDLELPESAMEGR